MGNKKTVLLSQLLPYDAEMKKFADLRNGLKEYQTVLRALFAAKQAKRQDILEKYDSLVGENACQIRAIWLCVLASLSSKDEHGESQQVVKAIEKIEHLLTPKKIDLLMRRGISLKSLLDEESLHVGLTEEETFIFYSFILAEIKTVKDSEKLYSIFRVEVSEPKKLILFGEVSSSFARSFISKCRKELATASVYFVRNQALKIQDPALMQKVSHTATITHNNLPCIPMFWTYKTMLKTAQQKDIPLIIHAKFLEDRKEGYAVVDEEFVFFKVALDGKYVESVPNEDDLAKAACVVQGVVVQDQNGKLLTKDQWKASITSLAITDVILAGAADHRQYPDPAHDSFVHDLQDSEYANYKCLAREYGFSACNPTTFFIQHVYAAFTKNALAKQAQSIAARSVGV